MRVRNSRGSESSTSSTILTKCSRFIFHPKLGKGSSLGVAVIRVVILVIFTVIAFFVLFVFFLVWLPSKENIGSDQLIRSGGVGIVKSYVAHAQWYASDEALGDCRLGIQLSNRNMSLVDSRRRISFTDFPSISTSAGRSLEL